MSVKQLAKRAIGALGYEVSHRIKPKVVGGKHYGPVRPVASYSPWLDDLEFATVFDRIKPNTLVDRLRCYELWELVSQLGHLSGNILEVGVWRGGTGALICRRAKNLPKNPIVYLCDTFKGVCKATDKDTSYSGGEHADTSEQLVAKISRFLPAYFPTIIWKQSRTKPSLSFISMWMSISRRRMCLISFGRACR
jgi:O-methyltransferase